MRSAQTGRIVHALLFVGPHGTGKKSMAELLSQTVLCSDQSGHRPCGVCPSCKKCLNHLHPDIHYVHPEKNTIRIDQIRELNYALGLNAVEGGKKIAIIDPAGAMGEGAQNALLKTLENPTGDTLFFLLAESPGALLPTVVSRCLQLRFRCLESDECVRVLRDKGVDAERARLLAALSQGSVGRALEIDADESYIPLRNRVIDAIESIKTPADVLPAMTKIGEIKGREREVFEILELWARDLMRVQNGADPLQLQDEARLKKSACCGNRLLQSVVTVRKQLSNYVSLTAAMENLLFHMAEDKG